MKHTRDSWEKGLPEEMKFWRKWFTEDEYMSGRNMRLNRNRNFQFPHLVSEHCTSVINILDLGSGPVSTLGEVLDGHQIAITPVDPLANEYNELINELGYTDLPKIIKGTGESLSDLFENDTFDIVFSANALDHSYDPLACIKNMIQVCKDGGSVYFVVKENEGERQKYGGLHQWNFEIEKDKVRLWNRDTSMVLNDEIGSSGDLAAQVTSNNAKNMPMLKVHIKM
jgi:SAM-dependent methyltransferase